MSEATALDCGELMSPSAAWSCQEISRFHRQYLQLLPDSALVYPSVERLRDAAIQETLYERLFADNAITFPPPKRYQLRILKELVSRIESSIIDWDEHGISDNLMLALSHLLASNLPSEATAAQQKCYVTYHLSRLDGEAFEPHITLLENRSLISASGTTGLRTWEASLHLGQYLCANQYLVQNKRVLELGAGTGYLAILCAKYLHADHVIVSDGSDDVINNLSDSFFLNGLQGSEKITPMELKWGHALLGTEEETWNGGRRIDVVLGADITYDTGVIPSLVATLVEVLHRSPDATILIAATERNRLTFEKFLDVSARRGLAVSCASFPVPPRTEQNGPFYSDEIPIHICQLRRNDATSE